MSPDESTCTDAAAASSLYANSAALPSLRSRSFGAQRFDAFSLLCLQPELAANDAPDDAAQQGGAVRDPNDPWAGVPASFSLQLIPSSTTSVTLRAMRPGAVA